MGNVVGILLLFAGIIGYLYDWLQRQKNGQKRVEAVLLFLQKSIFAIETENVKIIHHFLQYISEDEILNLTLREVAHRLQQNTYPKGQSVWEEVLKEEEQNWDLDKETFEIIQNAGVGFFGQSRGENICFLQKSARELEGQIEKRKVKDAQERKVWIPVGMLSGVMIVILFL